MEMESLDNLDDAETTNSSHSSQPAAYRNAQVWKDIEAETGFASYEDYLEYYKDVQHDILMKMERLQLHKENVQQYKERTKDIPAIVRTRTVIYDLSTEERYPSQPSLRCHCESGTELIQALRKPPNGVCVQLVFWLRSNSLLDQEMVDTLGLGLRLDLDDFDYRGRGSPLPRKSGPRIKSIFGEQTVAAISQGFMRDVANEVPVVLVASASGARYWDLLA